MLTQLHLTNFRCFSDHMIPLRPTTIIVGSNNAGKSTVIEALRLLSIVAARYGSLNFADVPKWAVLPKSFRGVSPSLKGIDVNVKSLFHNLGEPPATITATFDTGVSVEIYIGPEAAIHAVVKDQDQKPVITKSHALDVPIPKISILPQIAPLVRNEKILELDYARRVIPTLWASYHFRNQLNSYPQYFDDFRKLAEKTWPGLKVRDLEGRGDLPGEELLLMVHDYDFIAEAAWMGHGLQMWLQTMWFLARSKDSSTIILDEPDVYMHADLQRKLIRLLQGRHDQVVVATHSVEIMSEVDAKQVLIINRKSRKSVFATSIPIVQQVIENIGGVHNLQLARLWGSRRCLHVEGEDIPFLKQVQTILFPKTQEPFDIIPNIQLGGWSGWSYAIGSKMLLENAIGDIIAYCIFDSDYHTAEDIRKRYEEAKHRGVQLHIWQKKEIENYFLVPKAIQRIIASNNKKLVEAPTLQEVEEAIDEIVEQQKFATLNAFAEEFHIQDRRSGVTGANEQSRKRVEEVWKTREGRWSVVSGKTVISSLSRWSQKNYGVTLGPMKVLKELLPSEIDSELARVVTAIEDGARFTDMT